MLSFPGFDHIYELRDPLSKRPLRGDFHWEEDCTALTRGEVNPATEIRVGWAMGGRHPVDVIWTTSVLVVILHHRVLDLFQKHGVTGWKSYRVIVTDKDGGVYTDYQGLAVVGRCDAVDLSRSVVAVSKYPGGWYPHFLGHYFDENSWDGSDLFMARADSKGQEASHIFVTEKVREVFEKAKIKNLRLERLTEKAVSTSVYEIGCSHLLPSDFPQRVNAAYLRANVPKPS